MVSKGKLERIQRAKEREEARFNSKIIQNTLNHSILKDLVTIPHEENEPLTWKGYPIGKARCHCGSNTYISGRGKHNGWSGIECCACGNLMEACACGGRLPTKEQERKVINDENSSN